MKNIILLIVFAVMVYCLGNYAYKFFILNESAQVWSNYLLTGIICAFIVAFVAIRHKAGKLVSSLGIATAIALMIIGAP